MSTGQLHNPKFHIFSQREQLDWHRGEATDAATDSSFLDVLFYFRLHQVPSSLIERKVSLVILEVALDGRQATFSFDNFMHFWC